jgi:hypothetical protein
MSVQSIAEVEQQCTRTATNESGERREIDLRAHENKHEDQRTRGEDVGNREEQATGQSREPLPTLIERVDAGDRPGVSRLEPVKETHRHHTDEHARSNCHYSIEGEKGKRRLLCPEWGDRNNEVFQ